MVLASVGVLVTMLWLTNAVGDIGSWIDLSGRQRMLSQAVLARAYAVDAATDSAKRRGAEHRLRTSADAWRQGWARLSTIPVEDVHDELTLARQRHRLVAERLQLASLSVAAERITGATLDQAIVAFVQSLDALTARLSDVQARQVSTARVVLAVLVAAFLAMLLVLNRRLVNPGVRALLRSVRNEREASERLAHANQALADAAEMLARQNAALHAQQQAYEDSQCELQAQQANLLEQRDRLEAYAAETARFATVIQSSSDMVVMVTSDGTLLYSNPAAAATFPDLATRRGLRLLRHVATDDARRLRHVVMPILLQDGVWQGEIALRPTTDDAWPVHLTLMAQRDRFGFPEVYVITVRDMRAEHTLRASLAEREALHRAVVESLAEGVIVQDREGAVVAFNESAMRILDLSADQLTGREPFDPRWEAAHCDGQPLPSDAHPIARARLQGEHVDGFPIRITTAHGERRILTVNAAPMYRNDLDDRPGAVATFRDVTTEVAMTEEAERLSVIVRQSDYAVITFDRAERITWVNDAFESLSGYTAAEAIGQSRAVLMNGTHTSPETVARIAATLAKGAPFAGELLTYRRSGEPFWSELTITPLHDSSGTLAGFVGLSRDVTARRVADRERQTLAAALAVAADGVAIVDAAGQLEFVNASFTRQYGGQGTTLQGRTWLSLYDAATAQSLTAHVRAEVTTLGFWSGEVSSQRLDETAFPQELSITALPQGGMVVVGRDISDRKLAEERLRFLSTRDELTGLFNRRGFMDAARPLIAAALRTGHPTALLYGDLDRFKVINDSFGHAVGDRALREVAGLLAHTFRSTDVIARLGGDEFTVLASGLALADVTHLQARLADAMAAHNAARVDNPADAWVLGMSLGVAWVEAGDSDDIDALLRRADAALYEVKDARRVARRT